MEIDLPVLLFEGVCLVHTNVILASLRVEVGSERVGAFALKRAGPGVSLDRPFLFGPDPAKSLFFRLFSAPNRYSLFRPNIYDNSQKLN